MEFGRGFSDASLFGRVAQFRRISARYMPEGRNLDVFFQKVGIRKGLRWGDGILLEILKRTESGYGFSKRVQITNYPLIKMQGSTVDYRARAPERPRRTVRVHRHVARPAGGT